MELDTLTTYTKVRTSAKITNPDIFNLNFICYFYCYHTRNLHPTSRRISQKQCKGTYICAINEKTELKPFQS